MEKQKKAIQKKVQHYPTVLVGLSGWAETIKAIQRKKAKRT